MAAAGVGAGQGHDQGQGAGAGAGPAVLAEARPWNPMTNWQSAWSSSRGRCERLCCHSCGELECSWRCGAGPCADIACQACGRSIVHPAHTRQRRAGAAAGAPPPPDTRFVCVDCVGVGAGTEPGAVPDSVDFCSGCFGSNAVGHYGADGAAHVRRAARPASLVLR